MIRKIYIILCLAGLGNLLAQEATISNFKAIPEDGYMVLFWATDSGYTCATLSLFHSADSINYEQIYLYPGVCGSLSEPKTYNYIHSNPLPDKINYDYPLT